MLKFSQKFSIILLVFLSLSAFAGTTKIGDKHALIIIDMQPIFVTRGGNQNDEANIVKVKEIIKTQLEAIKQAKLAHIPIVFLEYEGLGETTPELKQATEGYADVKIFQKNTDGMFSSYNSHRAELLDYLSSKGVGNLIITGANGGACVEQSISGSLEEHYNVIAFSKGIADFNYKDFIYPYAHMYNFKPNCNDCKFKEADEMEVVVLDIATGQKKNSHEEVDDSGRGAGKYFPGTDGLNGDKKASEVISK